MPVYQKTPVGTGGYFFSIFFSVFLVGAFFFEEVAETAFLTTGAFLVLSITERPRYVLPSKRAR